MKRLINWVANHIVLSWAMASIIFAIVIHLCFSIPAPCQWLVAKWDAGDLLSYASTVALGLLAIWQNQKFKIENDQAQELMEQQNMAAQDRLVKINIEANELNLITRIVDHESKYILHLDELIHSFFQVCEANNLHDVIEQARITNDHFRLSSLENHVIHTYAQLTTICESGMNVSGLEIRDVVNSCKALYISTLDILQRFHTTGINNANYTVHYNHHRKAVNCANDYLYERRKILYHTLTKKMTSAEVRSIYGS